ncbi:partial acyl-CoA thioesterase I, partial [Anaerolineae bacterium]
MKSHTQIVQLVSTIALLFAGCAAGKVADADRPARIVFFGDSITEQGAAPGGYVTLIREAMQRRGSAAEIIGAGISGNKVEDLQARIDTDVLAKKPTIVVVYIGINDVWHWTIGIPGAKGSTKDQFESGLRAVIRKVQAAGATVVLCTPSVIGEKKAGANPEDAMLEEYSAISRRVAGETGSTLCDLRRAFVDHIAKNNPADADSGILTTDRVHL